MNNSKKKSLEYQALFSKEFLTDLHHTRKKTPYEISLEVGCDRQTVIKYMELRGVDYIHRKDAHGRRKQKHFAWKGHGDISSTYWRNVQNGARLRHIPLEMTIEQAWELFLKQDRQCALSGIPIGFELATRNSASLDRIDSSKGYTIDNVQWVHKDINFAKQSLTNLAFVELCRQVVHHADLASLQ